MSVAQQYCYSNSISWATIQIVRTIHSILFTVLHKTGFCARTCSGSRPQWSRGLRRRSAAALLLRLWVRIPPGAWMFVCCECCVLSGRGLCDELITRQEESYRLWCVVVCDLETSWMRRPWPTGGGMGGGAVAAKTCSGCLLLPTWGSCNITSTKTQAAYHVSNLIHVSFSITQHSIYVQYY